MHGKGVYTEYNGKKYEGEYKNGLKHGRGIFTMPNGAKYDG